MMNRSWRKDRTDTDANQPPQILRNTTHVSAAQVQMSCGLYVGWKVFAPGLIADDAPIRSNPIRANCVAFQPLALPCHGRLAPPPAPLWVNFAAVRDPYEAASDLNRKDGVSAMGCQQSTCSSRVDVERANDWPAMVADVVAVKESLSMTALAIAGREITEMRATAVAWTSRVARMFDLDNDRPLLPQRRTLAFRLQTKRSRNPSRTT